MEENKKQSLKFPVVLFDSKCPMCIRFAQGISKLDPESEKINVTDLHQQWIYETHEFLDYEKVQDDIHFINEKHEIFIGKEAISQMAMLIPQVKKFSWLIESESGQKALEYFHNATSRLKTSLRKSCPECTKRAR